MGPLANLRTELDTIANGPDGFYMVYIVGEERRNPLKGVLAVDVFVENGGMRVGIGGKFFSVPTTTPDDVRTLEAVIRLRATTQLVVS